MALTVSPPIPWSLSAPIELHNLPNGAVVDWSSYILTATTPMPYMVRVSSDTQNMDVVVKLGILEGNHMADSGLIVENTSDARIEAISVWNCKANGVVFRQSGSYGTFNNLVRIQSIRGSGGNGLILIGGSGGLGVQGNHFEIGQIINNKHSGICIFDASWANHFLVGPVEGNKFFGCYDGSTAPAEFKNTWHVVNENSNGFPGIVTR